jgi:hypothetical protein
MRGYNGRKEEARRQDARPTDLALTVIGPKTRVRDLLSYSMYSFYLNNTLLLPLRVKSFRMYSWASM